MKIILFAITLGNTRLYKISQEFGMLSNFGRCGLLGVKKEESMVQTWNENTISSLF